MTDQPTPNPDTTLQQDVQNLTAAFQTAVADTERLRRLTNILAVSLVFDIVLSIVLGAGLHYVNNVSNQAKTATLAACEATNAADAKQRQLWDFAFRLTPTSAQTPEQKRQADQFKAFVDQTFAPVPCK